MRLFIAADIADDTRGQLTAVREQLEAGLRALRNAPRITWVKPENAHVTLRFIGEEAEECATRLRTAMGEPLDSPPFAVTWDRVGTFPGGRSPRVVWIGATSGRDELAALAARVNARLEPLIGRAESRPFKAHLSVGRIRESAGRIDWPAIIAQVSVGCTTTTVDHVTLYQSTLSPKGPTYHPVCTWKLSSR
jgi:2'-5' RNA ligase